MGLFNRINQKKERLLSFQNTRAIIQVWKHAYRPFLLFELVYKLLTLGLFIPFMSLIFNKMLDLGGYNTVANHDLLRFIFSKYGLLSLILMAPVAVMLIYVEFAVLIYIAYYGAKGQTVRIRPVLLKAMSRLSGLWRIGVFGLTMYLLLLFPMLSAGFGSSLLPNIVIPNFITGELMKSGLGTAIFILFATFVFVLNLLCVYSLPILVLEHTNHFWYAARKSMKLFWKSKWSLFKMIIEWVMLFVGFLLFVFILFIVALSFLGGREIPEMVILGGSWLISVLAYTLTLVMTPLFITVITRLYLRYAGEGSIKLHSDDLDLTVWEKGEQRRYFVKQHRTKFATFGLLIMIAVGWGVTAQLTHFGEAPDKFTIMAHRGDVQSGVENTMQAFDAAIVAGADYIELDVLQTKDGKLAVIHDINLKRLSGHNVNVYDLTLSQLQQFPLHQNGFEGYVSSLDEVLTAMKGRVKLNVELKTHGYEHDLVGTFVDTIRRHKAESWVVAQAIEYELVQDLKKAAPELKVGYVIFATFARDVDFNADFFVLEESWVNARIITSAKLKGKPLYVWTVNDPAGVEKCYTLGVDGIITDITAEAKETVDLLQEPYIKTVLSIPQIP
ncbi:glycerophosphodiester phosphodiesterase [Paenibacillus sp. 481]|uniref:glycerophosphodiester phosphodiesterase n=1 Tax=Paenibacillus sp. 481 TaxID=2835869 RepID=UPI001E2DED2B|nr:glycerophosphodiester phosphodiesterase [Paenibacillus sp. 481]UHA75080.1 glycerophosphodiester phosphodiesterase [Paenibacillus sp. 481]